MNINITEHSLKILKAYFLEGKEISVCPLLADCYSIKLSRDGVPHSFDFGGSLWYTVISDDFQGTRPITPEPIRILEAYNNGFDILVYPTTHFYPAYLVKKGKCDEHFFDFKRNVYSIIPYVSEEYGPIKYGIEHPNLEIKIKQLEDKVSELEKRLKIPTGPDSWILSGGE